jgi:hypothetical protein
MLMLRRFGKAKQKNYKKEPVKWTDRAGVYIQFLLAVFTALLFYLALRQHNETLKEAEIQNRPYLQAREFRFIVFAVGKQAHLIFNLNNLGQYPAKILSSTFECYISSGTEKELLEPFAGLQTSIIGYIIKESPYNVNVTSTTLLSADDSIKISQREKFLNLTGDIGYRNESNLQEMHYKFHAQIFPTKPESYLMLINEIWKVDNDMMRKEE